MNKKGTLKAKEMMEEEDKRERGHREREKKRKD